MLIYSDSVVLIYWFDHTGPFHLRARNRMLALQASDDQMAISDMIGIEWCLVRL
jgi:hypothetical protein